MKLSGILTYLSALLVGVIVGSLGCRSSCMITCLGQAAEAIPKPSRVAAEPVDCSLVANITPVNLGQMESKAEVPYFVSFSWWDHRIWSEEFKEKKAVRSNGEVEKIQNLLVDTPGAFVDIGANVGFMANFGTSLKRQIYAVEPISYNVAKLCEGFAANVKEGWTENRFLHLYHAAAGPEYKPNVTITRPSDKIGKFDQTSLSRDAVKHTDVVQEMIPLLTVDMIVPKDVAVALVKIDVQGHEYGVLQGMGQLLRRDERYPKYVIFEDDPRLTVKAGNEPGACQKLLETHAYSCVTIGHDTLCQKD